MTAKPFIYVLIVLYTAFTAHLVKCQSITIDTLKLKEKNADFHFPIVRTGNEQADSAINGNLRAAIESELPDNKNNESLFGRLKIGNYTDMFFEVTLNTTEFISLNITLKGCGAYCSSRTKYFTYSTKTGKLFDIRSVIDTSRFLHDQVFEDIQKVYAQQKSLLKEDRLKGLIDEADYHLALEFYEACKNNFELDAFSLHNEYFEVISACDLPHYIKNLTPVTNLKYQYSEIESKLKINPLK